MDAVWFLVIINAGNASQLEKKFLKFIFLCPLGFFQRQNEDKLELYYW